MRRWMRISAAAARRPRPIGALGDRPSADRIPDGECSGHNELKTMRSDEAFLLG